VPTSAAYSLPDQATHGGEIFEVARRLKVDPKEILDFSSNINPLGPPLVAIRCIQESIWLVPHYPDISYYTFRKAAAEYVGLPSPENVVEGNGSTELIYLFADVSLREGDKAIIPVPSFGEYQRAVLRRGGRLFTVPCRKDFGVDMEGVAGALAEGCKALFLSNPSNPSSRTIPKKDLLRTIELAYDRGVPVLLDETFIEFTDDHGLSLSNRVNEFPNLFVLRSLTKTFALTGLRIGYGLASQKFAERLRKAKLPWSVNVLAQEAGIAALNDSDYLERSKKLIAKEREFLYSELKTIEGLNPVRPEANFVLVNLAKGNTAKELKSSLLRKRILIRDCSSFEGLNGSYFRVCVRLRNQNATLLSALREAIS